MGEEEQLQVVNARKVGTTATLQEGGLISGGKVEEANDLTGSYPHRR